MTDPAFDGPPPEEAQEGAPAWVMTFADLMSLLMCFFVLLLSFSEIEARKYKQVAGSMSEAFGVQRDIPTKEIPKGTSLIAREFSPGKPSQTVAYVIQQQTTDQYKPNLDFSDSGVKGLESDGAAANIVDSNHPSAEMVKVDKELMDAAQALAQALQGEIKRGMVEVVALPDRVAIRVRERGSFDSGSAAIQENFYPVLARITETLNKTRGSIVVDGHTDSVPIATQLFPSNWELSAARAAAFVHFMTQRADMNPRRVEIRAHGEMRPLGPNDSARNRARNRRVEISLVLPASTETEATQQLTNQLLPANTIETTPANERETTTNSGTSS